MCSLTCPAARSISSCHLRQPCDASSQSRRWRERKSASVFCVASIALLRVDALAASPVRFSGLLGVGEPRRAKRTPDSRALQALEHGTRLDPVPSRALAGG